MQLRRLMTRRNGVVLAATAVGALVISAGVAVATGGDGRDHRTTPTITSTSTKVAAGGVCKSGLDTEQTAITPPDDSTQDNPPAGKVVFTKACAGIASITFYGETSTSNTGDFIHLDFRATCIGTGGYSTHHCQVGNSKFARPGHTFLQSNSFPHIQGQSATELFTGLSRGKWRFEVLPGGNNSAQLVFRTTLVQAYNGG